MICHLWDILYTYIYIIFIYYIYLYNICLYKIYVCTYIILNIIRVIRNYKYPLKMLSTSWQSISMIDLLTPGYSRTFSLFHESETDASRKIKNSSQDYYYRIIKNLSPNILNFLSKFNWFIFKNFFIISFININ